IGVARIKVGDTFLERPTHQSVRQVRTDLVDGADVLVAGGEGHGAEGEARYDQSTPPAPGVLHRNYPWPQGVGDQLPRSAARITSPAGRAPLPSPWRWRSRGPLHSPVR